MKLTESELKAIAEKDLVIIAKQAYYNFIDKLDTIGEKIDPLMYITDSCIDRENVESRDENTVEFWKQMKSTAYGSAEFRLSERGLILYDLLK